MLDSLRSFAGSPIGIVVFGAIIAGLLLFGVTAGGSRNVVARVASKEITAQDFSQEYEATLNRIASQQGVFLSAAQAEQQQVDDFVLFQLIQRAAFEDHVDRLGLGISDERVAAEIAGLSAFQTSDGLFSQSQLDNYLRSTGLTEREFIDLEHDQLLRVHVAQAIATDDLMLPRAYRDILNEYEFEQRILTYTILRPALLEDGELAEPTEAELVAYFEANALNWNADEARTADLLTLTPARLADVEAVSDEEALAGYQTRLSDFGTPELRAVSQLIFPSQADADAVGTQLDAGATYEELVADGAISPISLGTVSLDSLFDPAVAEAAFSLEPGGTRVIEGRSGATLVHVDEVIPSDVAPYEDVVVQVKRDIAEARAAVLIGDLFLQIEDARGAGLTLAEIGTDFDFAIETVTFDLAGNDQNGDPIVDLPGANRLITEVYESEVGLADPPIRLDGASSNLWYEVVDVIPAHQRPLDEVRDRVVEAWRGDAVSLRLQTLAESVAGLLRSGTPVEEIEAELSLTFQRSDPLARASDPPAGTAVATVGEAFGGAVGFISVVPDEAGDGLVVQRVDEIVAPEVDPAAADGEATVVTSADVADALITSYLGDLMARIGPVNSNESLIRQIMGLAR